MTITHRIITILLLALVAAGTVALVLIGADPSEARPYGTGSLGDTFAFLGRRWS